MVFLLAQVPTIFVLSQGCVAIRNVGGISPDQLFENMTGNEKSERKKSITVVNSQQHTTG